VLINIEKIYYLKQIAIASEITASLEVMSASGVITNNIIKTTYPFHASGFEKEICEPVYRSCEKHSKIRPLSILQLAIATCCSAKSSPAHPPAD
jgi:hypothetical protein